MQTGKLLPLLTIGILWMTFSCSPKPGENTREQSALLTFINAEGHQAAVTTKAEWNQKRLQILNDMQKGMGNLPDKSGLPDFDLHYADSLYGNNYKRYTINFLVAENERVTAYLYIPTVRENNKRIPAMLALHETDQLGKGSVDGQGKNINLAYAKELAQRGYIVIAPDYPGFGESQNYDFENDRYESGTMKGIFNHMRCIDLLQSMPEVDPERIGVIGHSLGGHNSIFVGAFDERLKVVASSCGWTGYDFYDIGEELTKKYGGKLGPWAQDKYMPLLREKYNLDPEKIPFDFDGMIAAIAPRVFFSSSPSGDTNFDVKGVQHVIGDVSQVYRFLDVPGNLHVYYPDCKHDFPAEMRTKAYALIDSVFQHKPGDAPKPE